MGDPQELQVGPITGFSFGSRAGSGGGKTPGVEKADAAEMTDGGRPAPGSVAAVT